MSSAALPRATSSEVAILTERGYKLIKKLGEGSYGQVFLTEFTPPGEPEKQTRLACKIIDTSKAPKDFVRKFLPRELDILVKLNHPHLVHVHSVFQRRAKYYVFMRCAEKGDLLDFILANGPLAEQQCRIWIKQLALAMEYLHLLEIVHRDIKCENVLLTINNNVKLADFGFARYVVDAQGKFLLAETYCGSLAYAAPEIVKGTPYNAKKADIWSLGVVLFVMLNKTMPFDNDNMKKLYELQMSRHYRFRPKVLQNISDNVRILVSWMLEPEAIGRCSIEQIFCAIIFQSPLSTDLLGTEVRSCVDFAIHTGTSQKVIKSEWFAADPRGNKLTPQEEQARNVAIEENKEKHHTRKETAAPNKRKARLAIPLKKRKDDEAEREQSVKVLKDDAGKANEYKSVTQHLQEK